MLKLAISIGLLFALLSSPARAAQDADVVAHFIPTLHFGTRALQGDLTRAELVAAMDWPIEREDWAIVPVGVYVDESGGQVRVNTCRAWYDVARRKLKMQGVGDWPKHLQLAARCHLLHVLSSAHPAKHSMVSRDKFTSDGLNLPISAMPTDNQQLCDRRQRQAARGFTLADLAKEGKYKRQTFDLDGVRIVRGARIAYFVLAAITDVDGDGWADYVITQYYGYTGERNYLGISTLWLSKTDKGFVAGPIPPNCREAIGKP